MMKLFAGLCLAVWIAFALSILGVLMLADFLDTLTAPFTGDE